MLMDAIETSGLTAIDIVILLVMAVGIIVGLWKGVIKQAFSLGGLIAGLIMGKLFSKSVASLLLDSFNMPEKTASVIAFIIILIVVPIAFMLAGELLSKLVKVAQLGFVDRLLGALFGMLKYVIFLGLAIQLMEYTGLADKFIRSETKRQSVMYEPVRKITDKCLRWTWEHVMEHSDIDLSDLNNKE